MYNIYTTRYLSCWSVGGKYTHMYVWILYGVCSRTENKTTTAQRIFREILRKTRGDGRGIRETVGPYCTRSARVLHNILFTAVCVYENIGTSVYNIHIIVIIIIIYVHTKTPHGPRILYTYTLYTIYILLCIHYCKYKIYGCCGSTTL